MHRPSTLLQRAATNPVAQPFANKRTRRALPCTAHPHRFCKRGCAPVASFVRRWNPMGASCHRPSTAFCKRGYEPRSQLRKKMEPRWAHPCHRHIHAFASAATKPVASSPEDGNPPASPCTPHPTLLQARLRNPVASFARRWNHCRRTTGAFA